MKNMKKVLLILLLLLVVCGCKKKPKCPEGYNEENNKCVMEIERIEAEVSYYCDPDTQIDGENCLREITIPAEEKTGCKEGLTEENGNCVGTLKESATDAYKCNNGKYNSKTGKCDVVTYVSKATKTCNTEEDIVLDNGKCAAAHPGAHSYGEPGEVDPATECCCGDTFRNGWCYSLPDGNYDANITCPNGSTYTSGDKGKACYSESTEDAVSYKKCNTGYTLNGNECTKSVKEKPSKVYSCESGYTLNDKICEKTEATPAVANYHCPDDYEKVDNYCIKRDIRDME